MHINLQDSQKDTELNMSGEEPESDLSISGQSGRLTNFTFKE